MHTNGGCGHLKDWPTETRRDLQRVAMVLRQYAGEAPPQPPAMGRVEADRAEWEATARTLIDAAISTRVSAALDASNSFSVDDPVEQEEFARAHEAAAKVRTALLRHLGLAPTDGAGEGAP